MTQPQAYERTIDFTARDGDDTDHTGINSELDAAAQSINQIRENLSLVQKDDGSLKNGIVGPDQLSQSAFDSIIADINQGVENAQAASESAIISASTALSANENAQAAKESAELYKSASLLNANTATAQAGVATLKASEASASANTASVKASEASDSANTASVKASEASASATAAAAANPANREAFRWAKNMFPDPSFRAGGTYTWGSGTVSQITNFGGINCVLTPSSATATNVRTLVDVSSFRAGKFSASLVIHQKIGNQGANNLRVRLTAHSANTPNTQITTNPWAGYPGQEYIDNISYTKLVPQTDITGPTTIVICEGFQIPAGATHIGIDIRVQTTVQMAVSQIVLREGYDASYKDDYAATDAAAAMTAASSASDGIPKAIAKIFDSPNLVDNNWARTVPSISGGSYSYVESDGEYVLTSIVNGSEGYLTFGRSRFPSGKISVSADLVSRTFSTGGRIMVMQLDAASVEIPGTRVTLAAAAGVSLPYNMSSTVDINSGCVFVKLYISPSGGANGNTVSYRRVLLADGESTSWIPSPSIKEVYVSTSGNDLSGGGTISAPYASLNRAVAAIGGIGTVYIGAGDYSGVQLDISAAIAVELIGMESSAFARPIFRFGKLLTGVSKTAGYSKVYQSSVSLTGQPNWMWIDNLPDAQTMIPTADQHALTRGAANYLPCTKIWKTAAATLSSALAEIDAATTPKCFWDSSSGTVYFSAPGGGDASSMQIYASGTTGLFSKLPSSIWSADKIVKITGIDVRYGPVSVRGIRKSSISDVRVLGGGVNCFDVGGWADYDFCVAQGGGSAYEAGINGDGFNAHDFARWSHRNCHTSHNNDDGISSHENCIEAGDGVISEYNGGCGMAPANGAQVVYRNPITRKNALQTLIINSKRGGVQVIGVPSASADNGVLTSCEVYGGISIGDNTGYLDPNLSTGVLKVYNSVVINPVTSGYDCNLAQDCRYSGSAPSRTARTNIISSSYLT